MIDAVLSYHLNPATCGVAKFGQRLADELGVKFCGLLDAGVKGSRYPLVSVKCSEVDGDVPLYAYPFDMFFHDVPVGDWHDRMLAAARVFAANTVIAEAIRPYRSDVIEAWCPSTIEGNAHRGTINVLTFGMAHKIQTARYEKLKALLDATGEDYTVSVSTAIHEGSPWDETALVGEKLRAIFGGHLRVLGYLADDALVAEMARCTAVALFFDPAFRANNTTAWAVFESGKLLITNLDTDSPHSGAQDINKLDSWPSDCERRYPVWPYTWKKLVESMQAQPCAK